MSYDSSAITRVDDGTLAKQVAETLLKPNEDLASLDDFAIESAVEAFRSGTHESSIRSVDSDRGPALDRTKDVALPAVEWTTPTNQRKRQLIMIGLAAVVGILLAAVGLWLFLSTFEGSKTIVANGPTPKKSPMEGDSKPDVPPTVPVIPANVEPSPDATIENPKSTVGEGNEPPNKVVATDQALNLDLNAVPSAAMPPSAVSIDNPPADAIPKTTSTPVPSTAPIEPPADSALIPTPSPDLPDSMRRMSRLFDGSGTSLLTDAFASNPNTKDVREQINVESLYHPSAVELPKLNWLRESKIRRFSSQDQPLNRLMVILGQLAGGPIGWDSDHARYSGVGMETLMSLDINDQDVFSVLELQLKPLDIGLLTDSSEVVCLRANNPLIEAKLPTDWSIDDLIGKNDSLSEWRSLLVAYFPKLAARWNFEGQRIVWTSDASPLEKAYVAGFIDQIRVAGGLPVKSKLPLSVIDPMIGLNELDKRLAATGTRILAEPMSTPQLLDLAARDLGIELVFDWSSLYSHGFSHAAFDTVLLRGRKWPEVVRFTLDKFALVAVADGPGRIRLTTLPKQRQMLRTIIVEVSADEGIEKMMDRFRRLSPTDAEGRSVLLAQILPAMENSNPNKRLAAILICPPNTDQLRDNAIRRLLGLPVIK